MQEPYIKLYKKMLDWEWYDDPNTMRVFLHCLLKANWKPGSWHGINYSAGEFITSLETLAVETNLTINQVRTAIRHLKSTGEITSRTHSKCRIITVKNWDAYQSDHKQKCSQMTGSSQDDHRQVTTDKEYIEIKNIKNNNMAFVKPSVDEVREYCQQRNNNVDPETFVDFYESKGWKVGKNPMKDWKACVRTWEKSWKKKPEQTKFSNFKERTYDFAELERMMQ